MIALGRRIYGLGAVALGLVGLAWGDFALQWQPVPAGVPHRMILAYAVGAVLALAGVATLGRRTAALGAAALKVLYMLGVVLLHVPRVIAHPFSFTPWGGIGEQLALAAAGLVAYASVSGGRSRPIARIGRLVFGFCLLIFGLAHFLYLDFTASMVPSYIPPGRMFWAVATGIAHVAAGVAILTGRQARLAATLLTGMFAAFSILVHAPLLLADPRSHLNWVMNAMNLALTGAAWVVADSLGRRR
jgi:uncharacterized membrane protein YphA (DoxX/SURF4 family)